MPLHSSFTLPNVPLFRKDEHLDTFCEALSIAVSCEPAQQVGLPADSAYATLCGFTGRGWLIGFDEAAYAWEKHNVFNPPGNFAACSLEAFLAHPTTLRDGVLYTNHIPELLWNRDCAYPVDGAQAAGLKSLSQEVDEAGLRAYIFDCLEKRGRPVVALVHIPQAESVEMVLVTGYENGGAQLTVHSGYEFGSTDGQGTFKISAWEPEMLAIIGVGAAAKTAWEKNPAYLALTNALRYSAGFSVGTKHYGLAAYDAWAQALLDEASVEGVDDFTLSRRLLYHSSVAGTTACQKAFTSMPPCAAPAMGIVEGFYNRAAAGPGIIHGLMWDVWQVVGGYWRGVKPGQPPFQLSFDNAEEIRRFRTRGVREQAARVVRKARQVDEQSIKDFLEAKATWDQCRGRGGDYPCPCFEQGCSRLMERDA